MCTYTGVLLADTAVPAWHEAHPELPVIFAGSAMSSAAGAALLGTTPKAAEPARRMGLLGSAAELAASMVMERRLGPLAEPYRTGRAGTLLKAAKALTVAGAGLSLLGRRNRAVSGLAAVSYLAAGVCTRFGIYLGGVASTRDPQYVVQSQTASHAL
jgi:formate-dependent nitrite reductase membrane component NrfD